MKKALNSIATFIVDLIFHLGIIAPFMNQLYSMLYELEVLRGTRNTIVELIVSLSIVFLWTICSIFLWNKKKKTKLGKWYITNYSKMAFAYIFLQLLFISIRKEAIWDHEQMKDIVSIQWPIFGLSITVFLVWHMLIYSYFKKEKPEKLIDTDNKLLKVQNINLRMHYFRRVSIAYSTITYVFFNFFILFLITLIVYTIKIDEKVAFIDNLLRFSLLTTLCTFSKLLVDILKPLMAEKKEILQNVAVTNQEIDEHNDVYKQIEDTLNMLDTIDRIDVLTVEEKRRVKIDLIKKIKGENYNPVIESK